MDYEAILKLIEEGEAIVEGNSPENNPDAIRQLKTIADALLVASNNNGVIDQKCGSMMEFASIAYAPRRRQSYSREDGHQFAAGDLYTMRIHIRQHQHAPVSTRSERRTTKKNR